MANLTLSIPDEVLQAAREAAFRRGTTVNAVCRDALERLIWPGDDVLTLTEAVEQMIDRVQPRSHGPINYRLGQPVVSKRSGGQG